jgi:hypothetical protein
MSEQLNSEAETDTGADPSAVGGHQPHPYETTIIVNAQKKVVAGHAVTFQEVVDLAYDGHPPTGENWFFTVTYRRGPSKNPQGSLLPGGSVEIKEGMIFNVKATDRS